MRPIRNKQKVEMTDGREAGKERVFDSHREVDVLTDEGAVDTFVAHKNYPCECGCFKPPAGRCVFCKSLSCESCHGHCRACNAPVCRECSVFVDTGGGKTARFCRRCYTKINRREKMAAVGRFLLKPFVKFRGDDSDRR